MRGIWERYLHAFEHKQQDSIFFQPRLSMLLLPPSHSSSPPSWFVPRQNTLLSLSTPYIDLRSPKYAAQNTAQVLPKPLSRIRRYILETDTGTKTAIDSYW